MRGSLRRVVPISVAAVLGGLTWLWLAPRRDGPGDAASVGQAAAEIHLRRPPIDGWPGAAPAAQLLGRGAASSEEAKGFPYWAVAQEDEAHTYGNTGPKAWLWGKVRRGQAVRVKFLAAGDGCERGNWYETPSRAYLCNTRGFLISRGSSAGEGPRAPAVERALPFSYMKATRKPTLQFAEVPDEEQLAAARAALGGEAQLPAGVAVVEEGAYLVAVDRSVESAAGSFLRTIRGHYLVADDLAPIEPPRMRGELIAEPEELPLAFVYREDVPVLCLEGDAPESSEEPELDRCGRSDKHARFGVVREIEVAGKDYVLGPDSVVVARRHVRLARQIEPPGELPDDERWIHFDLAEQTLVAYEGDVPVFATLISSGKEGYDTPAGLYQVYLKYISTRMSGDDPNDGPYDIGEVPWVMFYEGSFAVHGAYWHDTFGQTRSHGCTNLAPADARWIYYWSSPSLPQGWHGKYARDGTYLYFTLEAPAQA